MGFLIDSLLRLNRGRECLTLREQHRVSNLERVLRDRSEPALPDTRRTKAHFPFDKSQEEN